jgi:hypothetical protein
LRESRQPTKLSGSHLASTNAEKALVIGLDERVYESTKLAALFDVLIDQGCPAGEILRNVDLQEEEVHAPTARISLAAFRLCAGYIPDPTRVEQCLRQSKPDLSDACRLARP